MECVAIIGYTNIEDDAMLMPWTTDTSETSIVANFKFVRIEFSGLFHVCLNCSFIHGSVPFLSQPTSYPVKLFIFHFRISKPSVQSCPGTGFGTTCTRLLIVVEIGSADTYGTSEKAHEGRYLHFVLVSSFFCAEPSSHFKQI